MPLPTNEATPGASSSTDYYATLGVSRDATTEEINAAYKHAMRATEGNDDANTEKQEKSMDDGGHVTPRKMTKEGEKMLPMAPGDVVYSIAVTTGDAPGAGSSSAKLITVYGSHGQAGGGPPPG